MLTDGANTYTYNAEGEITTATGVTYTYDGDGNRIEKSSGKIYWYGAGSEILDETDLNGNIQLEMVYFGGKRVAHRVPSSGKIYYYEGDLLGSARTIVQAGQTSVCYDADFPPFGGERAVIDTCSQNYKFEGKKRDNETGNDDFGARYYRSNLGRWLSADWSAIPAPVPYANLANPQTLNLYAMVSDNPETFADLDGHCQTGETAASACATPPGTDTATPAPQSVTDQKTGTGTGPSPSQDAARHAAQQQGAPTRVVRTGEETYSKPTKMTNAACPSGCTFEGKIYSYQVVDAKGKPVTSSMTVTEHLKRIQGRMGKPLTAFAPAGNFKDAVGRTAPFGAGKSVTDQTFTVTVGKQNYNLSTTIRQTVVVDDRGRVSVSERIRVP